MELPIDLTKMGDSYPEPCCSMDDNDYNAPRVTFTWEKPYGFPDEGVMTVRYKIKRREENHHGDKVTYEESLKLVEILDVKDVSPPPPARSGSETSDALDKLKAELDEKEE